MYFESNKTYHICNRSNELVYRQRRHYLYFLDKVNKLIKPYAHFLAWCLMPNHFHFLIVAKEEGCSLINENHRPNVQVLSKNMGTLLSSYSRAFNNEIGRKGKLFSHNTLAKCLNDEQMNGDFLVNCFHYIHQNPLRAELCDKLEEWEFSSYPDYAELRNGKLVNRILAGEMLPLDEFDFMLQSYAIIEDYQVRGLF